MKTKEAASRVKPALKFILPALISIDLSAAVFQIDPSRSNVSLSGSVIGFAFQEQSPGSLASQFEGTIDADVTDSSIAFTGSSLMNARNSGNWEPKPGGQTGTDPANFGAKASAGVLGSAVAAIRNVQLDIASLPLSTVGGGFNPGSLVFQFPSGSSGSLDYNVSGVQPMQGSLSLAGLATNRVASLATISASGDTQTLTVPIDASFFFKVASENDTTLNLTGQIVATRSISGEGNVSFQNWIASQFGGATDPAIVGPAADPDLDGISNLVEFAFGLNPMEPDAAFAPLKASFATAAPGMHLLEFVRPKGLTGVKYQLRVSDDLKTWSDLAAPLEITDIGGGQEKVVVRDTAPMPMNTGRFVVLVVSEN